MRSSVRRRGFGMLGTLGLLGGLVAVSVAGPSPTAPANGQGHGPDKQPKAVFFASDGLRQDLVAKYAAQGVMPTMRDFLRKGIVGDRRRPADAGPAQHRRRLVLAGHRRMAGGHRLDQQHLPRQRAAVRQLDRRRSTPACCRPSRSPSRPSAAASRSPRSSGPAAATPRSRARRSTSSPSPPGAAWPRTSSAARTTPCSTTPPSSSRSACSSTTPTAIRRRPGPVRRTPRRRRPPAGPATCRRATARRRRCACGSSTSASTSTASTPTSSTARTTGAPTTTRCCSPATKSAADSVGLLSKGQWADVKVTIQGGALDGMTGGMLVKVEELTKDLSRVRLFHTSVSRAIASWPTWPGEPGFTGDFAEYLAQKFPTSTAADFADPRGRRHERGHLRRAGPVLGDRPPADARVRRQRRTSPTSCSPGCRRPTSSSTSSSGSSARASPAAGATRPTTTSTSTAGGTAASPQRERYIRTAYQEADETLTLARELMGKDPNTFVSSDHGFAPQFLAVDASLPLVQLGLLSTPQTGELPPGDGRDDRQGQGVLGRRGAADLPQPGRPRSRPAAGSSRSPPPTRRRPSPDQGGVPGAERSERLDPRRPARRAGRSSTARSPRPRRRRSRTDRGTPTVDMAHPTRTGDLVVFAYPPYQFDAETPGHAGRAVALLRPARLCARRPGPPRQRQHAGDLPRRRPRHRHGPGRGQHDRPRADARVPARHPRAPAQPGAVLLEVIKGGDDVTPGERSSGSTTSTASSIRRTLTFDGINATGRRRVVPRHDVRQGAQRTSPGHSAAARRR